MLPNLLSTLRLGLGPLAGWAIVDCGCGRALWIFAVAAITDAADGLLARRWGVVSRAGAYLDPLADKLLMLFAYLGLWLRGAIPGWVVAIILGRDFFIVAMAAAGLLLTRYREFPPSRLGKISTVVQALGGVCILLACWQGREGPGWLFWLIAAVTLASGMDYARRGWLLWRLRQKM